MPGISATPIETRVHTIAKDYTKVKGLLNFPAFARFDSSEVRMAA